MSRGYSLCVIAILELQRCERALAAARAVDGRRAAREPSKRDRGLELVATGTGDGLLDRLLLVLRDVGLRRRLLLLRVGVLLVAGGRDGWGLLRVRHVVLV